MTATQAPTEPLALEAAPRTGRLAQALQTVLAQACAQDGFWGQSPAGLRTLKEFIFQRTQEREAALARAGEYLYSLVSLTACAATYATLWLIRKPLAVTGEADTLPGLGALVAAIDACGAAGRLYGYGLALPAHALGYGLAYVVQLPERLAAATPFAAALYFQLFDVSLFT